MQSTRPRSFAGGTIVDGTGAPPFSGDVVITGDRIVFVGELQASQVRTVRSIPEYEFIDCAGCDLRRDLSMRIVTPTCKSSENRTEKLLQGVTTEVVGNCGFSAYPVPENPQVFRDFANGILCGDDTMGHGTPPPSISRPRESRRSRTSLPLSATDPCESKSPAIPAEHSRPASWRRCAACSTKHSRKAPAGSPPG